MSLYKCVRLWHLITYSDWSGFVLCFLILELTYTLALLDLSVTDSVAACVQVECTTKRIQAPQMLKKKTKVSYIQSDNT